MLNQINEYPEACDAQSQGNLIRRFMPDGMFKGMKALRVSDQSNTFPRGISRLSERNLEPGFAYLRSLRTLIIEGCVTADAAALWDLKSLSLSHCKFLSSSPYETGELMKIRLLDLQGCQLLRKGVLFAPIFVPNVMSQLSRLEEFYLSKSFIYSRDFNIIELNLLPRLITLTMSISDFGWIPEGFIFPHLKVFQISMRSFVLESEEPQNYLDLSGIVSGSRILTIHSLGCAELLLKRTNQLYVEAFMGLSNVFPSLMFDRESLSVLRCLQLMNCDDFEHLISTEEWKTPLPEEKHHHICLLHLQRVCLLRFENLQRVVQWCSAS